MVAPHFAILRAHDSSDGHRFSPSHVVGFYLWRAEETGTTYLRVAFCGTAEPPAAPPTLDEGIVGVHWLSRAQLLGRASRLRSPMVLRCFDDYMAGRRYSLDCLTHLDTAALTESRTAHA